MESSCNSDQSGTDLNNIQGNVIVIKGKATSLFAHRFKQLNDLKKKDKFPAEAMFSS